VGYHQQEQRWQREEADTGVQRIVLPGSDFPSMQQARGVPDCCISGTMIARGPSAAAGNNVECDESLC